MIKKIRSEEYYLLSEHVPMILAFLSPSCGACALMSVILNEVQEIHPELLIFTINYDKHKHLREQYHVSTFPTLLFYDAGEELSRIEGLQAKPKIMHEVDKLVLLPA